MEKDKKRHLVPLHGKQNSTPPRVIYEQNLSLSKKCHLNIDVSHIDIY